MLPRRLFLLPASASFIGAIRLTPRIRTDRRTALVSVDVRSGAAGQFQTVSTTPTMTFNNNSNNNSNVNNDDASSSSSASFSSPSDYHHQQRERSIDNNNNNNTNNVSASQPHDGGSEQEQAMFAHGTHLMRFRLPGSKPEQFYFSNGDSICRLCNEFVPDKQVKFHLVGAGPRGPSTHMGREIILDSLVHFAKAGYEPRQVMRSWAYTLLSVEQNVRLRDLLPADPCDLEARATEVNKLLHSLKKLGIIDISISPHSDVSRTEAGARLAAKRRLAFERLECVGDNAWGSNLSGRMVLAFADKKWAQCNMYHSFNTFRDLAETNSNLERMFDVLNISSLLPPASKAMVGDGKIKADIFEAILGELHCILYAHESNLWGTEEYTELNDEHLAQVCVVIRHALHEIFDLTLLFMLYLLAEHAVPIAREIALTLMLPGPMKPTFDAGDAIRTRRPHYNRNFVPTFNLPPMLGVSRSPPCCSLTAATSSKTTSTMRQQYGPAVNTTPKARYTIDWDDFVLSNHELCHRHEEAEEEEEEEEEEHQHYLLQQHRSSSKNRSASHRIKTTPSALALSVVPMLQPDPLLFHRFASSSSSSDSSSLPSSSDGVSSTLFFAEAIEHQRSKWRKWCPFRQLSKYPPQAYNPYGIDSEEWMRRWLPESSSGRGTSDHDGLAGDGDADDSTNIGIRAIFHKDVCDNVHVVVAQFEATASLRGDNNMKKSTQESSSTTPVLDADDAAATLENLTLIPDCTSHNRLTYDFLARAVVDRLEQVPQQEEEKKGEEEEAPRATHVPLVQAEVLEMVHPFQDGITVGTEGASLSALSGAIASTVANKMTCGKGKSGVTLASLFLSNNNNDMNASLSSSSATTSVGDVDLEEIRRRNQQGAAVRPTRW